MPVMGDGSTMNANQYRRGGSRRGRLKAESHRKSPGSTRTARYTAIINATRGHGTFSSKPLSVPKEMLKRIAVDRLLVKGKTWVEWVCYRALLSEVLFE